jgi:Reverse transcriptase (RNA-dependent DNA polymerase)
VLDELDRELERLGHRHVRYADDSNIYVQSEQAGHRVMESITRFISQKLKLKVNESKSAVARPQERKFLGFSFTSGPEIKRAIAPVDNGGADSVYAGVAELFRLLPNIRSAGLSDSMGPVATPSGFVAAMEDSMPS